MLEKVIENWTSRLDYIRASRGSPMPEIIFKMICTGTCQTGYVFKDGFSELAIQCVRRTGEWTPTVGFPDCEPICSPECLNGGRCIGHNSCLCPKEYRGSRCEYAYSNCDGHDRFASVGWKCEMSQKETICNISCPTRFTKLQPSQPTTYTCSLDGTWQPDLKPICVRGNEVHVQMFPSSVTLKGNPQSSVPKQAWYSFIDPLKK
ncbi:putative hemocytin [Trichonephila clavipes]|nr:putative hemocytin [Trichonephila clavipes]